MISFMIISPPLSLPLPPPPPPPTLQLGEILCTLHRKVMEEHQSELQPGAALVFRQVQLGKIEHCMRGCVGYCSVLVCNICPHVCIDMHVRTLWSLHILYSNKFLIIDTQRVFTNVNPAHCADQGFAYCSR